MIKPEYDSLGNYYFVSESMTDPLTEGHGFQILGEGEICSVKFLRFLITIQTFYSRTRNGRLWNNLMVKRASEAPLIKENLAHGGLCGELDHPCPDVGQVSIERIVTIKREKISHAFKEFYWKDNDRHWSALTETVADPGKNGTALMMNILQGLPIAMSNRSVIPQKKNADGSTDQTGVGRLITADCVLNPGCQDAYKNDEVPITQIIKNAKNVQVATESIVNFIFNSSEMTNRIMDDYNVDPSTATIDANGNLSVSLESTRVLPGDYPRERGTLIIPQGKEIKAGIRSFMNGF